MSWEGGTNLFKERMRTAIIAAILLGFICIIGFVLRDGFRDNGLYILSLWYNRLLMGIVIGLAVSRKGFIVVLRGAFLGLLVSLGFFLATGMVDPVSFFAGIIYGVVIDVLASRYNNIFIRGVKNLLGKLVNEK